MDPKLKQQIREIYNQNDISMEEKSKLVMKLMNPNRENSPIEEHECTHYQRKCLIQCIQCLKFYQCRICHDEYQDHKIDRHAIQKMKCKLCYHIQDCSKSCTNCNLIMATYYCDICHLFIDNSDKPIHHCPDCGICRVGNNKHCHNCHMCINQEVFDTHQCTNNYDNNCCICHEDMKYSRDNAMALPCNHTIHSKCYQEYITSGNYQCPLCKRSLGNMQPMWDQIEAYVKLSKMPEEYQDYQAEIFCNDCQKRSITKYHFAYHQCQECHGWNTNIIETIKPPSS